MCPQTSWTVVLFNQRQNAREERGKSDVRTATGANLVCLRIFCDAPPLDVYAGSQDVVLTTSLHSAFTPRSEGDVSAPVYSIVDMGFRENVLAAIR